MCEVSIWKSNMHIEILHKTKHRHLIYVSLRVLVGKRNFLMYILGLWLVFTGSSRLYWTLLCPWPLFNQCFPPRVHFYIPNIQWSCWVHNATISELWYPCFPAQKKDGISMSQILLSLSLGHLIHVSNNNTTDVHNTSIQQMI